MKLGGGVGRGKGKRRFKVEPTPLSFVCAMPGHSPSVIANGEIHFSPKIS